ncbi:MAG: MBL fold metallo-hydrolase [Candidatus Acetothermia bacterium]
MTIEPMMTTRVQVGSLDTNCYILSSSSEILVIDPGGEPERIAKKISQIAKGEGSDREVKYVVSTHGHWDHVGAVDEILERFQCEYLAGESQESLLKESGHVQSKPTKWLSEGDHIPLGSQSLSVWSTPGHSPGSITLLDDQNHNLYVGDLIFAGGFGRTDLPGGSADKLETSIRRIIDLDVRQKWKIYPGHGPETTLEKEVNRSPYLQKLAGKK